MAGKHDQRLAKVEHSLTPKQAVLLWMEEAHKSGSVHKYALSLKGQPDSAFPLIKLPKQVETAVRDSMKGQKREWVDRTVERAVKDVIFLFKLQFQANIDLLREKDKLAMILAWLFEKLHRLREAVWLDHDMADAWWEVCRQLPYPLDHETAAAVKAATENWVETWRLIDEGGTLSEWVKEYFAGQGKTELPFSAYYLHPSDYPIPSYIARPTEEEVRKLFADDTTFQEFMAGTDFSYGLADVRDAEFEALYDGVHAEMEAVVESGTVSKGTVLRLETVPVEFLRNVPLVDGEWIDAHVIEIAEWGATLMKRGYTFKDVDDNSPYVWDRIGKAESGGFVEAEGSALENARKTARANLARYSGRRSDINGRDYISFQDYSAWKGRSVKGKLEGSLSHGLLSQSWNLWVDKPSKEGAELAGVKVGRIDCYTQYYSHTVYPDEEVEQKVKDRNKLLNSLRRWTLHDFEQDEGYFARISPYETQSYRDRVLEWKEYARAFMEEIYVLQDSTESVSQRYFDGRPVLFPDTAEGLAALIQGWEGLLEWYNDSIASDFEAYFRRSSAAGAPDLFRLDAQVIKEAAHEEIPDRITYLVDQAKADTLRIFGDSMAASKIMEKHLD